MNPYLLLDEYIPDAEPRVFEGRLYVYGSHDLAGGEKGYCAGDYMVYSAPLDDLSDFRLDSVAFRRQDCPDLTEGDAMAAPDCVKGIDGAYYLYFNTNRQKVCRIARSESPAGPFTYYGEVQRSDGTAYDDYKMFDPGVLVDDGHVYLYVGFCMPGPVPEKYRGLKSPFAPTSIGYELASDMKTIISGPFPIIPGGNVSEGTGFEGHSFYEASSPRKINDKYVMVYSSEQKHELCYAVSDKPLEGYKYKGVLISNCDLGYEGNTEPVMPYGNNHGGLVMIDGDYYIFYHRQTHGIECCRQGCAQKLIIDENGDFKQAQVTSGGLSGTINAKGVLNSAYCCGLASPDIPNDSLHEKSDRMLSEPHIYEDPDTKEHYIKRIKNHTKVTFKYFDIEDLKAINLSLKGESQCKVSVMILKDGNIVSQSSKDIRLPAKDSFVSGGSSADGETDWKSYVIEFPGKVNETKCSIEVCFDADKEICFKEIEFIQTI